MDAVSCVSVVCIRLTDAVSCVSDSLMQSRVYQTHSTRLHPVVCISCVHQTHSMDADSRCGGPHKYPICRARVPEVIYRGFLRTCMALLRIYRGVTERTQTWDAKGHVTPGKSEGGKRERVRG